MSAQDLRERRKNSAMLRVQEAAIALFEKKGFDAVTMDDVAREADVGVASVYRWFSTKENLIIWDEYDPDLIDSIRVQLIIVDKPVAAVLRALIDGIGAVYKRDKRRILRRADLVARTPALTDAARINVHLLRAALADVLKIKVKDHLERQLLAAVLASTLEVAVEEWRVQRGKKPLDEIMVRAFEALERL
ncbi:MAG: helix-turn-helix domain-containing protein [Archangium sp.]